MEMNKTRQQKAKPTKATKPKLDDDFVSVARRLGADEDKERFEKMLGKIAKAKPPMGAAN